ncbi:MULTISPECIES: hypothetical protein [Pseudomonas]|uniref:hypothetical protein n=1 Tax=Pseudomonas TaxID=286 RepID=UPI002271C4DD|nr:hypothetical protein [Pseudomonas putida]WAC00036.1 hypothetical protein OSW16_10475 [Pseudomonas putida]
MLPQAKRKPEELRDRGGSRLAGDGLRSSPWVRVAAQPNPTGFTVRLSGVYDSAAVLCKEASP